MNKLPDATRIQILSLLVEGVSMRSISRLTGVSINTVSKLLVDAGRACAEFHDAKVRKVQSKSIQADEIWSFCYAKERNVSRAVAAPENSGDVWTWTAICAESKLIISWLVGSRGSYEATTFLHDLRRRVLGSPQITTDAHSPYLQAMGVAFGDAVDYAQLIKVFGRSDAGAGRYSPPSIVATKAKVISGNPDGVHVSTSFVERQNLTMRMSMRRFTRLTNGFSKKFENHCHSLAIYFFHYNWIRVHKTLRITPAMAASLSEVIFDWTTILKMINASERQQVNARRLALAEQSLPQSN